MLLKLIASVLIALAVFMGGKQGWAMLSLKPQTVALFSTWSWSPMAIRLNGIVTLLSTLLILFPRTFIWGNFLMAAGILLISCFHLFHRDLKGVAIEIPFLLLNLLIIYLGHPLAGSNRL